LNRGLIPCLGDDLQGPFVHIFTDVILIRGSATASGRRSRSR
jgi:hypothetical protein